MRTRFVLCTAITIALLAAPVSALAADVVVPSSVAGSTTVPAGGSTTLTLRCPGAAVALNAAVTRRGAGVTVRRSIPGTGSDDWRFRLKAASGARSRGLRAVLRCVRLALPAGVSGTRLVVSTRRPPSIPVPAGSPPPVEVNCARGFAPTGYGIDSASGDVKLAAAVPGARGWSFRLENTGTSSASARLSVRCLRRVVSGRRGGAATELSFGVTRRKFSNAIGAGAGMGFGHSCARSQFSVATGIELDAADAVELRGSHPVRSRGGRWEFSHASAGDRATSFLVCLSLRSQFG